VVESTEQAIADMGLAETPQSIAHLADRKVSGLAAVLALSLLTGGGVLLFPSSPI
jgi:hypothetical protein